MKTCHCKLSHSDRASVVAPVVLRGYTFLLGRKLFNVSYPSKCNGIKSDVVKEYAECHTQHRCVMLRWCMISTLWLMMVHRGSHCTCQPVQIRAGSFKESQKPLTLQYGAVGSHQTCGHCSNYTHSINNVLCQEWQRNEAQQVQNGTNKEHSLPLQGSIMTCPPSLSFKRVRGGISYGI
jgi:hypothetical protein